MFEKIKAIMNQDYDHEQPDIPRSKDFNKAFRAEVRKQIKPFGFELLPQKSSLYCGASGFVKSSDGKFVYFNSGDYRWDNPFERILIRTAKDEKDYTGGGNHYCDLKDFGTAVKDLMH